jgi:hypothetical protein
MRKSLSYYDFVNWNRIFAKKPEIRATDRALRQAAMTIPDYVAAAVLIMLMLWAVARLSRGKFEL